MPSNIRQEWKIILKRFDRICHREETRLERDERALEIAKEMVRIPSVNTTEGERHIAEYLEQVFTAMPYFQKHPEQLAVTGLKDDPFGRRNVMALVIGEKRREAKTLLLHGHTDTVGVEDFGGLKDVAFDPDALMERMKTVDLPEEVKRDLESGAYFFGRGSCDMKSGDAVFISLVEWLSNHVSQLSGNVVISLNPVEENLHTGILEGIDTLLRWKKEYGLTYQLAINNDYTCPLYEGDPKITLYTGVVGKLLPCFYIRGKETHVGQCFEGMDASYTAARLVDRIHLNMDYSDVYDGEASMPPSVLKMKDLKPWYNVQTAKEALVYFNWFVYNEEIGSIEKKLVKAAEDAFSDTKQLVEREAARYFKTGAFLGHQKSEGKKAAAPSHKQVMLYEELVEAVMKRTGASREHIKEKEQQIALAEEKKGTDLREIPVEIIRYLLGELGINDSVIVIYFAPPYCPHNMLQKECADLEQDIKEIVATMEQDTDLTYRLMHFFPSLSDSSYLKIDDSEESIQTLKDNFPVMERLYPVPLEKIRELNVPAVDFGCYGKDAHKWTERVHIPYTFEVLPHLLRVTLKHFAYLGGESCL